MSRSDDYLSDMSEFLPRQRGALDDLVVEALFGASSRAHSAQFSDVAVVLTQLRAVVDLPAPAPSPELAVLLEHGIPHEPQQARDHTSSASPRRRFRVAVIVAGVGSLVSLPVMGVAAAHDRLPDAAQHVVARVIEATTPFTVTDPGEVKTPDVKRKRAPAKASSDGDRGIPFPYEPRRSVPSDADDDPAIPDEDGLAVEDAIPDTAEGTDGATPGDQPFGGHEDGRKPAAPPAPGSPAAPSAPKPAPAATTKPAGAPRSTPPAPAPATHPVSPGSTGAAGSSSSAPTAPPQSSGGATAAQTSDSGTADPSTSGAGTTGTTTSDGGPRSAGPPRATTTRPVPPVVPRANRGEQAEHAAPHAVRAAPPVEHAAQSEHGRGR